MSEDRLIDEELCDAGVYAGSDAVDYKPQLMRQVARRMIVLADHLDAQGVES